MKILLMLLALGSACYGRMGETLEECKSRYGKPVWSSKLSGYKERYDAEFKKDKVSISVSIVEGKVAKISYWRMPEGPNRNQRPFSYSEYKHYRTINGGGRKWARGDDWDHWQTQDKELSCSRMVVRTGEKNEVKKPVIHFFTKKFSEWVAEEMADQ